MIKTLKRWIQKKKPEYELINLQEHSILQKQINSLRTEMDAEILALHHVLQDKLGSMVKDHKRKMTISRKDEEEPDENINKLFEKMKYGR